MDFSGRNSRVGVGVGVTIGLGEFQYIKPQLYMEIDVHPGEDSDKVREELADYLIDKLLPLEEKLEKHVS